MEMSQAIVATEFEVDELMLGDLDDLTRNDESSISLAMQSIMSNQSKSVQRFINKRNSLQMSLSQLSQTRSRKRLTQSSVGERISLRDESKSVVDQVSRGT
jgi:hypothetical protein